MPRGINMEKPQKILPLYAIFRINVLATFYIQQTLGLLISAYFLLFIYPKTDLDQTLITPYFDVATHSFPLKHQFFLDKFMHSGLKYWMILIAIAAFLAGLQPNTHKPYSANFFHKVIASHQKNFMWGFIGMLASTSTISFLKSISMHGCPHDLTLFGGQLPLLDLFAQLPAGVAAGHCFPGGHASGGFALMAFYFAFREYKPRFAKAMLVISLLLGFAMGWAQVMRGEHFLSHNLWSAWVVWMVLFVLFVIKKMIEKN
jgi:membrane-associated PAP2 superfamily phosphatase